jgi:hypothetical protein
MAKFSFCDTKQENDWVYTPNQGALRCVPPAPPSRVLLGMLLLWHRFDNGAAVTTYCMARVQGVRCELDVVRRNPVALVQSAVNSSCH